MLRADEYNYKVTYYSHSPKKNTYRLGFVLTWQKESGWSPRPREREKESLPFLIIYNSEEEEEEGERIGVGWFEGWGMEGLAMLRQLIGQLQELLELYGSHPSSLVLPSPSLSPLPHPLHLLQPLPPPPPPPPPLLSQFHSHHQHQQHHQQQQQHHRFFFYLSRSLWAFWLVCTLHRNRLWFHFPVFPHSAWGVKAASA